MEYTENEQQGRAYGYELMDGLTESQVAQHRQNLSQLVEMMDTAFSPRSLFNNPNDPADSPRTFEELMGLCSWAIAGMPPALSFGVFQDMFVSSGESEN